MSGHAIERTIPKGQSFVGTCTLCGLEGLTMQDMGEICANPRHVSADDALLQTIRPHGGLGHVHNFVEGDGHDHGRVR